MATLFDPRLMSPRQPSPQLTTSEGRRLPIATRTAKLLPNDIWSMIQQSNWASKKYFCKRRSESIDSFLIYCFVCTHPGGKSVVRRSWVESAAIVVAIGIAAAASATETVSYKYDAKGRLVKVVRTGTVNNGVNSTYTYDKADNRTNVNVSGSSNPPP